MLMCFRSSDSSRGWNFDDDYVKDEYYTDSNCSCKDDGGSWSRGGKQKMFKFH